MQYASITKDGMQISFKAGQVSTGAVVHFGTRDGVMGAFRMSSNAQVPANITNLNATTAIVFENWTGPIHQVPRC
jgi:hypothetical protein